MMSLVVNRSVLDFASKPGLPEQDPTRLPPFSKRVLSNRAAWTLAGLAIPAAFLVAAPTALMAQTAGTAFPVRAYEDSNGVDLFSGEFVAHSPTVRIGDSDGGLTFQREVRGGIALDSMIGGIYVGTGTGTPTTVSLGGSSEVFTLSGSTYTPMEQNGSTLVANGTSYTYTKADGTVAIFDATTYSVGNASAPAVTSVTYPSGKILTFYYTTMSVQVDAYQWVSGRRLQSVVSNTGYQLKLTYQTDSADAGTIVPWEYLVKVTALNTSVDSCAPTAYDCTVTATRPKLTIDPINTNPQGYTDAVGNTTKYTFDGNNNITAVQYPASASLDIQVTYAGGKVSSVTSGGVKTNYSFVDSGNVRTVTVTRGSLPAKTLTFDIVKFLMLTSRDELGNLTQYGYDSNSRLQTITYAEGNSVSYAYDPRGNQTSVTTTPKAGSGLTATVVHTSFPATCANGVTCNLPTSSTDMAGNVTTYSWDPVHGGLLSVTGPAAPNGIHPQTRLTYTRLDATGAPSSAGIYKLTGVSTCRTAASCSGTADETKTTLAYGNHLLRTQVTIAAGDGSSANSVVTSYDDVGNATSNDGPLGGSDDTTYYRYDANRVLIGSVGPDPDGAGPLKRRASRLTYDRNGRLVLAELGTVNGTTDADWSAFSSLVQSASAYDSLGHKTSDSTSVGGATVSLRQYAYDTLGRPACVADRMNPAAFTSEPDACTLGTQGTNGPDRIGTTQYDALDRVTSKTNGFNSPQAATEATTYTQNGMQWTATDAAGNRTTFEYDGFDRLVKIRYPVPSAGALASSTTDFELRSYDANSNVASVQLRDGSIIHYSYDNLGRLTQKTLPSPEASVSYAYDLQGQLTSTSDSSGNSVAYGTDAFGRTVSETTALGTLRSAYDAAGRRTSLTWPDNFFVTYDYDLAGELIAVRESGAQSGAGVLAQYSYDDLGRRLTLTRGNGTSTSYTYDTSARLGTLTQNLAGTANDVSLTFLYNQAGQITTRGRSNSLYAPPAPSAASRTYSSNGLNQFTNETGNALSYDGRGNLTAYGANTYSYTAENHLTAAPGGAMFSYDPMGRLRSSQLSGQPSSYVGFLYDGVNLVGEYNSSGALQRRYIFGATEDEPLAWYEGTGTTDRRWLHADERGSVIAVSDLNGNPLKINSYDEHGLPTTGNLGRFQFTGQAWLPELGAYYFKARIYASGLGRFLQADPSGYSAGLNRYLYAGDDPISNTDPSGLEQCYRLTEVVYYKTSGQVISTTPLGIFCIPDSYTQPRMDGVASIKISHPSPPKPKPSTLFCRMEASLDTSLTNLYPTANMDTPTEKMMMQDYFQGTGGTYTLNSEESAAAVSFIHTYIGGHGNVVGRILYGSKDGWNIRQVNFGFVGSYYGSGIPDHRLDGLLGTATVLFNGDTPLSVSDTFNFDAKDRGWLTNIGTGYLRKDAKFSCPNPKSVGVVGNLGQ
jgi:RHS repeat-associated protein